MLLRSSLCKRTSLFVISGPLALASAGLITGCGVGLNGPQGPPTTPVPAASVGGVLHGGPNPIVGATVKLYATQSNGYNGAGLLLGTTSTGGDGGFNFNGTAATCPSGQQAYITAAGGNTGGGSANANSLLMAALGDCSTISQNTHIFINELTTVAAGYALSNFIKISGTGAAMTVDVSAPATNNATPANATCTGTGAAMTCTAAGLTHAFQNAANLVYAVDQAPASPTGVAYSAPPSNSNGIVPALLINTLGNILQSCVNSTGGTAGDSSNCGNLFTNTTPPSTSTSSPVTPANTLQAVVNLAKYPTMTPPQVTALFSLQAAQVFYTPQLASAPNDYSMAVIYRGPTGSTNYVYSFYSTTDVGDHIYTAAETGNGSGPVVINGMNSNGSGGFQGATVTGAECVAGSPCASATDTAGHLWLANTNSTNLNVYEVSTTDGSLVNTFAMPTGTAPNSAAVDKFNDVFVTSANITSNDLFIKTPAASSFSAVTANSTAVTESVASPEYIAIDAAGNLWNTNYNSANTTTTFLQNTGGTASETFGNAFVTTTESATTPGQPYTIMLDGSGNAWVNNVNQLFKVTAGATSAATTLSISGIGGNSSATANTPTPTAVTATSARFSTLDGDGNIFFPDNSRSYLYQYFPATGNFVYISPCAGATGTCLTTSSGPRPIASPRNAVTDSTGSIWITNPIAATTNSTYGNVTQIIGTGAPAWGQMSYGKPGVRP